MRSFTKDNVSNVVAQMRSLYVKLKTIAPERVKEPGNFYVCYIAHGVKLAILDCLSELQDKIIEIGKFFKAIRLYN